MVKLTRMEVESIGCTKLRGYPCYFDGNKLYFEAELRDKKGKLSKTKCCMDCSISRKKWDLVTDDQWPIEPKPWDGALQWTAYAYARWIVEMHALEVRSGRDIKFPVRKDFKQWKDLRWEDCTLEDFKDIFNRRETPYYSGEIVQVDDPVDWFVNLYKAIRREAEQKAAGGTLKVRGLKNANFKPMREIGEEDTAFLLGLFNFDGDKKALCTALKSSWNADLSDKDVKVDSLVTKKFTLPKPLEDYIP